MPKVRDIQNNFTSGFIDENLIGRIDLEQYRSGLKQAENVLTLPQGPIRRRDGTLFIDTLPGVFTQNATVPTMVNGGTPVDIIDDDPSTTTTTTTAIGVLNPYVVAEYDLGSAKKVLFVDVIGILFDASGTSTEFEIQWSTNGSTWNTLFAIPSITAIVQDIRVPGVTAQFFRIARIGSTDLTTLHITLGDFLIHEQSTISNVRMADFELSDDNKFLIVFTFKNLRIYKNDIRLVDLGTQYLDAEIKAINFAQADTALIIVHEEHEPARLVRGATDADWSLTDIPFINITQLNFNDTSSPAATSYIATLTFVSFSEGDRFQIDIDGAITETISYTTVTATLFKNIQREVQKLFILGETGVSVTGTALIVTLTLADASAGPFEAPVAFPTSSLNTAAAITAVRTQAGISRKEDLWSTARGFPKTATFYLSRLYFWGTKSKPQSLLGSRIGQFFDFDTGEGFDDDGIFITVNTKTRNTAAAIVPARLLQLFSASGEFAISQVPPTPKNITPQTQTNHGTSDVDPVEIDGSTLFIERKGRTLREFLFSLQEQAFLGSSLSFLAQSLINTPIDMAALRGRFDDDSNYVFIVNTDGTMAVYNVLRSQGIGAFTKWSTAGLINAVRVVDDEFYMSVTRNNEQFLERFDKSVLTDAAISKTQASSTIVTGLDHLNGLTVRVKADGSVLNNQVVANGQITMERAGVQVEVGLNYNPTVQPNPLVAAGPQGSAQMEIKKIYETKLNVIDTTGLVVSINGNDPVPLPSRAFGEGVDSPLDVPPTEFTGVIPRIMESLGYADERLQSIVITQVDPVNMTIASISSKVETA